MKKNKKMPFFIDIGFMWNVKFIIEGRLDYQKLINDTKNKLYYDTLNNLNATSLNEVNGDEFLTTYLKTVEKEMSSIIAKYNLYELFFWTRRIPPKNVFNVLDLTILLYKEVLTLSIIKYGKIDTTGINLGKDNQIMPSYIIDKDPTHNSLTSQIHNVLSDCYLLEILSMLYVYATQRYRIYCKGAKLIETQYDKFDCIANEDKNLRYLINLYDRRLRFSNVMSLSGTSVNTNISTNKDTFNAIFLTINPGNKISFPFTALEYPQKNFNPNYIPYPYSLEDYYNYMLLFKKEFKETYDFSVDYFVSFVLAESHLLIISYLKNITARYRILQRAYSIIKKREHLKILVDVIKSNNPLSLNKNSLYKEFEKIYNFLTYTKGIPRDINLWTRGPRKIYIPIADEYFIADYSGFGSLIETIMLPISRISGETGNKKSAHFEKKTNTEVIKIFSKNSHWIGREKICNNKGECKEVDASFYIGKFLFILECKSINVSFGFDKGDVRSINYRIERLKEGLKQVDDKAIFIAKNKYALTKPIPRGVEYVVPILITAFPEYIWERSENLFLDLDKDLPRILTLKELQEIKNINLNKLTSLPYIIKLNNHEH